MDLNTGTRDYKYISNTLFPYFLPADFSFVSVTTIYTDANTNISIDRSEGIEFLIKHHHISSPYLSQTNHNCVRGKKDLKKSLKILKKNRDTQANTCLHITKYPASTS
jgi:hypothetical protein